MVGSFAPARDSAGRDPVVQVTSCVYRVEHGLIVEYWIQIDRAGLAAQLRSTR